MPGKLHLDIVESQTPVVIQPHRVPIALKAKLKAELERLEDLGVIQKGSGPTDWVANLVIAEKPNGKLRVCIDPQHLNKGLKRSHYHLPLIDDVLPELEDVKVFSKIDLKEGIFKLSSMMNQACLQRSKHNRGVGGILECPLELNHLQSTSNTDLINALKAFLVCMQPLIMHSSREKRQHMKKLSKIMMRTCRHF